MINFLVIIQYLCTLSVNGKMFETIMSMLVGGQPTTIKVVETEKYDVNCISNTDKEHKIKSVTIYVKTTKSKSTESKNSSPKYEETEDDEELDFEFVN